MPEASIRHEVLSVSFDGSGMYSLYIEDSFGAVVYQSMLPADGMEHDYDLSGIGEGHIHPYAFSGHGTKSAQFIPCAADTAHLMPQRPETYY